MADMGGSHHFGASKSEPRRIMNSNIALEDQFDAANVGRPAGNIQEAVHALASKKHYAPALDGLRAI